MTISFLLILLLSQNIKATWDSVPDADFYRMFWGTNSGEYTDSTWTTKTVLKLPMIMFQNPVYYFAVKAVNGDGNVSKYSEETSLLMTSVKQDLEPQRNYTYKYFNIRGQRTELNASGLYIRCRFLDGVRVGCGIYEYIK